ncbi:Phytocyanin domain [Arabidopsis suecica]|uniref:Phytocyanin domain n=1 Tax=Arabidopsis suecica TaxID=45249 RepID=A0A8T2AGS7_ARASU|nr:Phytocyanin domain [Arabidopsis suecica]
MSLIKSNVFFISLLILLALCGVSIGGTVHQVGDSNGWTIMSVNYERWASSRTFHVGDSLVFKYNKDFHDVTEVTDNDFKQCEPSKPLTRYETGSDTVILTKPGLQHFICGFPSHCDMGQKLQIHVLPASLGPVAAPVPGPVRSPSSLTSPSPSRLTDSPVNNVPQYQMGPSPAPLSVASYSSVWIGLCILPLLSFFILV